MLLVHDRIHDLKDENNLGLLFFKEGNQLEKENFEGNSDVLNIKSSYYKELSAP